MGDLVPDRVFHQLGQVCGVLREALVRALEYGDAVGHRKAIENAARRKRAAFVKAQKRAASWHTAAGKLNAVMTAHTPSGCHVSIMRWPGRSEAMVRP